MLSICNLKNTRIQNKNIVVEHNILPPYIYPEIFTRKTFSELKVQQKVWTLFASQCLSVKTQAWLQINCSHM